MGDDFSLFVHVGSPLLFDDYIVRRVSVSNRLK